MEEALKAIDTKRIYYKYCATFDCTDEGNIGPAAEVLLAVTGGDRVIFAPAFPEYSVTVFQGRLFVGDRLLSESFKQFDPVTPMTNANLMQVLEPADDGTRRPDFPPRAAPWPRGGAGTMWMPRLPRARARS